mmetsp:Transcript_35644/g.70493  ORF Transcript_35644/g.70493 Transcript_35644/m.70493 type:complete len:238 (-) Transcript_35644:96-809(-)
MTARAAVSQRRRVRLLELPLSAALELLGHAAEQERGSANKAALKEVAEAVHERGPCPMQSACALRWKEAAVVSFAFTTGKAAMLSWRFCPASGGAVGCTGAPATMALDGSLGAAPVTALPCHTAVFRKRDSGLCGHASGPAQQPPPVIDVIAAREFDAAIPGFSEPCLPPHNPFAEKSALVRDASLTMHCPFHAGCPWHGTTEEERVATVETAARGRHGPNRMLMAPAPEGTCGMAP